LVSRLDRALVKTRLSVDSKSNFHLANRNAFLLYRSGKSARGERTS
jgi:hypothetical protein